MNELALLLPFLAVFAFIVWDARRIARDGYPEDRDKREVCGCHRECTTLPHVCARPCRWPDCLNRYEHAVLADELAREL